MKDIYMSCYSSKHVIHIPSFRTVNLLSCGDHFSNITAIDAKAKYRSPHLFWGRPQHVLETQFCRLGSTHLDLI